MSDDARFEDGHAPPLRLRALDTEDLQVISAATQDAVFPITEMRFQPGARRFAVLLNRFRWETLPAGGALRPERVQSVLSVEDALRVASQGIDRRDSETVLSLLELSFEAGPDGTGAVLLTLAGDGAVRVEVEALEVILRDVTRPYPAPSGRTPAHGD